MIKYLMERKDKLIHIDKKVSPRYDIPNEIKKHQAKGPIIFENVDGYDKKIISNIYYSREELISSLGISTKNFLPFLHQAINNPLPCEIQNGPVSEVVDKLRTNEIPFLTYSRRDKKPYHPFAMIYTKHPEQGRGDVSYNRIDILDENRLIISVHPSILSQYIETTIENGEDALDICICLGVNPLIMLAGALYSPFDGSGFDLANSFLNGELTLSKCPNVDAYAPSNAELVIEGKIMVKESIPDESNLLNRDTREHGISKYVVEIVGTMHRKDYLFHGILSNGFEQRLLQGLSQEFKIWNAVSGITSIGGVRVSNNCSNWSCCTVSLSKNTKDDARKVINTIFEVVPTIKHVMAVDLDIDPYDLGEVELAFATRFQGEENLVFRDEMSSNLETSIKDLILNGQIGFDATFPYYDYLNDSNIKLQEKIYNS